MAWLWQARDALENALQDSFDELDENPWVQLYAQDEATWDNYLRGLTNYVRPRARQRIHGLLPALLRHHLRAIAKPGGLFEDTTVTRLPWRGKCGACAWWSTGARVRLARPGAASHPSRR